MRANPAAETDESRSSAISGSITVMHAGVHDDDEDQKRQQRQEPRGHARLCGIGGGHVVWHPSRSTQLEALHAGTAVAFPPRRDVNRPAVGASGLPAPSCARLAERPGGCLRRHGARRLVREDLALHPLERVVDRLRVAPEPLGHCSYEWPSR